MKKTLTLPTLYHLAIGLCAIIIGAYSKMILIGLIPLVGSIIWGCRKKKMSFYFQKEQWGWIILYLIYFAYSLVFWDDQLSPKQIEYKLAWLIFPLIFSFRPHFTIKKEYVVYGFAIGILIASLIGIGKAITVVYNSGFSFSNITSGNITINHPTYFSMGALLLLIMFLSEWQEIKNSLWSKLNRALAISFILIMITLSYSMASFLFLISLGLFIWIYHYISQKITWKRTTFFLGIPLAVFFFLSQLSFVKDEFANSQNAFSKYWEAPTTFIQNKNKNQNGDEIRLIMWTATFQECLDHPFGIGPTRIGYHLSERLEKFNQNKIAEMNNLGEVHYNPHNQFLQMALELGLIPLLFFLKLLIEIFRFGIKNHSPTLPGIISLLAFQCLFESMLQRQTGIVTFSFFISLFILIQHQKKTNQGIYNFNSYRS